MTEQAPSTEFHDSRHRRKRSLGFWFTLGVGVVALIATAYLGTMTVLWGLHIRTLRTEASELERVETERSAELAQREDEVKDLRVTLARDLETITDGAHQDALYGDLRYVYDDYAAALEDCADARADVLYYVRTRFTERWIIWQVQRYDDEVAVYCSELKQSWAETLAEEES